MLEIIKIRENIFFSWQIPIKSLDRLHIVRTIEKHNRSSIEVSPFIPTNWYTEQGAKKKMFALEKKGLPDFNNWRFLTLTVDQLKFQSSKSAYEYIKPRMRFFIRSLKQFINEPDLQYCWKLEFQENGFPHWHMLINYKKPICVQKIFNLWDYGYVKIEQVKTKKLPYTFKYICKDTKGLPSWFKKLSRPRVFQSSGLFSRCDKPSKDVLENADLDETLPRSAPESLGDRLIRYSKMVLCKNPDGKPFKILDIGSSWADFCSVLLSYSFARFESATRVFVPKYYIQQLQII